MGESEKPKFKVTCSTCGTVYTYHYSDLTCGDWNPPDSFQWVADGGICFTQCASPKCGNHSVKHYQDNIVKAE